MAGNWPIAEWILGNFYRHYSSIVSLWTLSSVDFVYSSSVLTILVINLILLFFAVRMLAWFVQRDCDIWIGLFKEIGESELVYGHFY